MTLPWPIRSVMAGAVGTAAMSLAYNVEHQLRPRVHGPLDYDDSLVPGQIVKGIMHLPNITDREEHELGLGLRWSYGSAFGQRHGGGRVQVDAVPPAGPHAAALALATERDCDRVCHPRRLRGGRGGGRRPEDRAVRRSERRDPAVADEQPAIGARVFVEPPLVRSVHVE